MSVSVTGAQGGVHPFSRSSVGSPHRFESKAASVARFGSRKLALFLRKRPCLKTIRTSVVELQALFYGLHVAGMSPKIHIPFTTSIVSDLSG